MRKYLVPLLLLLALVVAGCGQDRSAPGRPSRSRSGSCRCRRRRPRCCSPSALSAGRSWPSTATQLPGGAQDRPVGLPAEHRGHRRLQARPGRLLRRPGLAAGLSKLGIPALKQPAATGLDDTYAQLDQLGKATGHEAEAGQLAATMRAEIEKVTGADLTPSAP